MANAFWGSDYVCGLDANTTAYDRIRGQEKRSAVVIVGPDGELLCRAVDPSQGAFRLIREDKEVTVPCAVLMDEIQKHLDKGLLAGVAIPEQARLIATAIKCGRLAEAQAYLTAIPDKSPLAELKKTLQARFEDLRKSKLALFEELLKAGKEWDAYKVGESYLRCFPKAEDATKVRTALAKLAQQQPVRDNLKAKQTYASIAAKVYGSKGQLKLAPQASSALQQIATTMPETEYGAIAAQMSK